MEQNHGITDMKALLPGVVDGEHRNLVVVVRLRDGDKKQLQCNQGSYSSLMVSDSGCIKVTNGV